jgi:hypothetical protein
MLSLYRLDQRHWKRWQAIAGSCQQILTEQQIADGNTGTILADVNTLLGFVGPEGIVTKSKNASLPADRLPELNLRVSHPTHRWMHWLERFSAPSSWMTTIFTTSAIVTGAAGVASITIPKPTKGRLRRTLRSEKPSWHLRLKCALRLTTAITGNSMCAWSELNPRKVVWGGRQ